MKGGDILDFQKGGNLRKGGLIQKMGGMTPLTNYATPDNSLTPAVRYYGTKTRIKFTGSCLNNQNLMHS